MLTLGSFEMTPVSGDLEIIYSIVTVMTYTARDNKISSWPAAGAKSLILAIVFMTSSAVIGSDLHKRELFCVCVRVIIGTNLHRKR